ncbi:MAG: glycosyltransferase family 2 protein [Candidatus Omnitrophica bacterium]|nr:glycosyltransferase family 2 protein [Candidatus Omnitrophota bacterium]
MVKTPILLFAFKRPDHTLQVLQSLSKNKESQESDLFVFIDGPRSDEDIPGIEAVKKVVQSRKWCKTVNLQINSRNNGVPAQIIGNVTKFCKERGRVIVLEDDIVLSPFFLNYMNKALDAYANDDRVMEVSGYMYPIREVTVESGFIRGSCGWGWGTWRRAWEFFEPDGKKLLKQLSSRESRYEFNFRGSYKYYSLLKDQVEGKIGGWDIRWAASIFLNNGLTFVPASSLVRNIGFDGSGTNIPTSSAYDTTILNQPIIDYPQHSQETEEILSAVIDFYKEQKTFKAMVKKLISRIRQRRF